MNQEGEWMKNRTRHRLITAALAALGVLWAPAALGGECSTSDLTVVARGADLATIEGILKVADQFEVMARRQPECAADYYGAFRGYYREARQRWAQSVDLARRRWPLLAVERERERAPVAAQAARAGWVLVDDVAPYRLEEDSRWALGRFGSLLPPSWGDYLRQVAMEEQVRADAAAYSGSVPTLTLVGWLSFWEAFSGRYGAGFELAPEVQGRLARLRRELGR